ncbi:hypothetical protein NLZ15_14985 [Atlantibacter subterranea]|uniref:hypothetical protein n=1 Tax=Atlantibacter subterraneus TaxID=255519 RepID=UPI0020C58811|nr:hypothetical protein [Atlantibacter subterranea]UTJ46154.1 hypothetical protein NLZ15_14985 [Atlantibacter subterranea]
MTINERVSDGVIDVWFNAAKVAIHHPATPRSEHSHAFAAYTLAQEVKGLRAELQQYRAAEPVMYVMADGDDFDTEATSTCKSVVDAWVEEWNGEGRCPGEPQYRTVPLYRHAAPQVTSVPVIPDGLHPATADLVSRFAAALAEKLHKAEQKYGYDDDWKKDGWSTQCQSHFHQHIAKGDPRDVAAYCAFMWHHGWPTKPAAQTFDYRSILERIAVILHGSVTDLALLPVTAQSVMNKVAAPAVQAEQQEHVSQPYTLPETQFKPVADLYGIVVPGGRSTSYSTDAAEASDCRVMDWDVQEYVKLERLQDAITDNSPVIPDGWLAEAERLAELHGASFVLFRHGQEPVCADPSKFWFGYDPAAPEKGAQEVKK